MNRRRRVPGSGGCRPAVRATVHGARGRKLRPGFVGADKLSPLRGIVRIEQGPNRNVDEPWIPVMAFAVRECELDRLGDGVNVLGRVVTECFQVDSLKQGERLGYDGTLAPGSAGIDINAAVAVGDGRFDGRGIPR